MVVDAWPERSSAPFGPPASPLAMVSTSTPQPGSSLKNGRYRITLRMHSAAAYSAPALEPPLLVASDTELGNERVLVQELPTVTNQPAEMDAWRRTCADRFAALAQQVGAPRLIDQFAEGGHHFLVYELPSGDLLSDRLQRLRGPMDERQAIGIILQVLDVLSVYERQYPAFIHGNICPENIVLRPSGQVALIGFSPALLISPQGHLPQGSAGGVAGYAAPEQARGQASTRSDLFAVCAVLHHCVTGSAPSPRARGMFPPVRQSNPNVSLELEEVLGQGLRISSTQRFQTSRDLRRALEPLVVGQLTLVPHELRDDTGSLQLTPVRDARGRLVLPRKQRSQSPALILGISILLIALLGAITLFAVSPRGASSTAVATPTVNSSTQLFQTQGIGLSGGEFIFDTSGNDATAKEQGAQALNAGDLAAAERAFTEAMAQQQDDPEAAIYAADVRVLMSKTPYITVVAAVSYADAEVTREVLQGIYLAQRYTNAFDVLPAGLRVRVLILNSAQDDASATTAAKLLLQDIQRGNAQHLAGIIGWPESAQTQVALSTLAPSGLALISPTATGDHLDGRAAFFFPLVPPNAQQAQELAQAAATQLNARRILVLSDHANPTSVGERQSFLSALGQYPAVAAQTASYTSGDAHSLQNAAALSAQNNDDLIFLACDDTGCDNDSLLLAHAAEGIYGTGAGAPRILVSHQAFTPALLGMGNDPVATAARNDPAALQLLDVTELASPDEWQAVGVPAGQQPALASDFAQQFGNLTLPNGLSAPGAPSILAYDAARLLLNATQNVIEHQGVSVPLLQNKVRLQLLQISAGHPFVGVGGALAYTITGRLAYKALVIASLTPQPNPGNGPVARPQIVALTGGPQAFCSSTCTPS
jgi:serine/threonine protein kinase/ABC-type branched-subunit amino acid transport system substrate-binding protein